MKYLPFMFLFVCRLSFAGQAPLPASGGALCFCQTAVTGTLHLTWTDNSVNEEGFRVEQKANQEPAFSLIAELPPDTVDYTARDLIPGETYCYRVSAFNDQGQSDYSNDDCEAVQ